ncbi:MAG: baseplate J/gp47 family protein [Polyangiaceae bacterium]
MSLPTPSTQQLSDNMIAQISAQLGQSVPFLPKAFINVLAKVWAGTFLILFKYAGFIWLQLFVAYASNEPTTINGKLIQPLTEWGRLIGVGDSFEATQAQHTITVTVTAQVGSLASGTALLFPATGVIYETVAAVALSAVTVTVTVRAVSDQSGGDGSGSIGNLQPADVLEFANPPPNVVSKAPVLAQVVTGADDEDVEVYRARIISRFQSKPQGGARSDYRAWGDEAPGIINVYPYPGFPGEIDVYCEADVVSSGSPDGIPTSAQLAAALATIEKIDPVTGIATRRPMNAAVNTLPIFRTGFAVLVSSLDGFDPSVAQPAIQAGVDEHLRSLEPYIFGLSVLPRKDRVTQANVAAVVDGIVSAQGGTVASVALIENGSPITSRDLRPGEKAKLNLSAPVFA